MTFNRPNYTNRAGLSPAPPVNHSCPAVSLVSRAERKQKSFGKEALLHLGDLTWSCEVLFACWDCFIQRKKKERRGLPAAWFLEPGPWTQREEMWPTSSECRSGLWAGQTRAQQADSITVVRTRSWLFLLECSTERRPSLWTDDAQPWQQLMQIKSSVSRGKLLRPQTKVFYSPSLFVLWLLAVGAGGQGRR